MTTNKSYLARAADTRAATAAELDKLQAARAERRVLNGDDDTAADRSVAGLTMRYYQGDSSVTASDVAQAEATLRLVMGKIDFLIGRYNRLRDRELPSDLRLCEALAPAVADALGGVTVEVTYELPEHHNRAHAPKVFITPRGRVQLDAETGELAGQVRLAFLRTDLHRELDVRELSVKLEDEHGVRLSLEARSDGTSDLGDGVKLDKAHLDVRAVLPELIVFAADHQPNGHRAMLEEIVTNAARATGTIEAALGHAGGAGSGIMLAGLQPALSAHEVNAVGIHRVNVEDGIRTVFVRGELVLSPRVHGDVDDVSFAVRALRTEMQAAQGVGFAGLGRVTASRVIGNPVPIRTGDRAGAKLTTEFELESAVEGSEAQQAA